MANERHCLNSIPLSFDPDDKEGGDEARPAGGLLGRLPRSTSLGH